MSQLVQSLERRMLMSVTAATLTADLQTIQTDATAAATAHNGRHIAFTNAINALAADLKAIDTSANRASNNKLIAKLRVTDAVYFAKIVVAESSFISTVRIESALGTAHGKSLLAHPTIAAFSKLVAKDVTNLDTNVPAKLAVYQTALTNGTTAFDTVGNEIAAANPTVATLIATGENGLATKASAASTAASQVATDASKLATDLASISA